MILRAIKDIVIHCAATPNGHPLHVGQIDAMHAALGFKRSPIWIKKWNPALLAISHHFFIGVDGSCATGRNLDEACAYMQQSIEICLAGTDKFTRIQWTSLRYTMVTIARQLVPDNQRASVEAPETAIEILRQRRGIQIAGHRELSPRVACMEICPGFPVADWLRGGMQALKPHEC